MDQVVYRVLLFQIVGIACLLLALMYFIKYIEAYKFEKRFTSFSLSFKQENELSILDKIVLMGWKGIHSLSFLLKKSKKLRQYSHKYDRYLTLDEQKEREAMDYVSLKFSLGILFVLFRMGTVFLQYSKNYFLLYLVAFLLGFYLPDIAFYLLFRKKRKRMEEDLLKAIIMMKNCFQSGRSIRQTIQIVKTELTGPLKDEFKKIDLDIQYGLSIDVAFNRFYDRVKLPDARLIASSLTILNKTGGNISQIFSSIERTIMDKKKLQEELKSLTSANVFVFRFLLLLPIFFSGFIYIVNPTYFTPLFKTKIGLFILLILLCLYSCYILIIHNLLKVKS